MMRTLFIIGHNEKVSRSKTVDDDGGNAETTNLSNRMMADAEDYDFDDM